MLLRLLRLQLMPVGCAADCGVVFFLWRLLWRLRQATRGGVVLLRCGGGGFTGAPLLLRLLPYSSVVCVVVSGGRSKSVRPWRLLLLPFGIAAGAEPGGVFGAAVRLLRGNCHLFHLFALCDAMGLLAFVHRGSCCPISKLLAPFDSALSLEACCFCGFFCDIGPHSPGFFPFHQTRFPLRWRGVK